MLCYYDYGVVTLCLFGHYDLGCGVFGYKYNELIIYDLSKYKGRKATC